MKKNIIIFTLDTMRKDHLGIYGSDVKTPNIDRIAADGTVFNRAYTMSTVTVPSHTSIMTGLYPFNHGARTNFHAKNKTAHSLAEILKENGYATGAALSMTMQGLEKGFDMFDTDFGLAIYRNDSLTRLYNGIKKFLVTRNFPFQKISGFPLIKSLLKKMGSSSYSRNAENTTNAAMNIIKEMSSEDKPMFLWVHYIDPHAPYSPPPEYADQYYVDKDSGAEENSLMEQIDFPPRQVEFMRRWLENVTDFDYPAAMYKGEITYMDHHLGRLVECLKKEGIWDNSVSFILADHGEALGDHGQYYDHDEAYDNVANIPFVIRAPGLMDENAVCDSIVSSIDILPTIVEMLGLSTKNPFDGKSLLKISGPNAKFEGTAYFETHGTKRFYPLGIEEKVRALVKANWKIIAIPDTEHSYKYELYDVAADPKEKEDVAGRNHEKLDELKKELFELISKDKNANISPDDFSDDERVKERLRQLGYLE